MQCFEKVMSADKLYKYLTFFLFVFAITFLIITSHPRKSMRVFSSYIKGQITSQEFNKQYLNEMRMRELLINLSGRFLNSLGCLAYFNGENLYITQEKNVSKRIIYSSMKETSTTFESEQIIDFYYWCSENGIDFLYVNAPEKYTSDKEFETLFHVRTYANSNVDILLNNISMVNVPYLDLRNIFDSKMAKDYPALYRTDHHWTAPSGLWASQQILHELNLRYDFNFDDENLKIENYSFQTTPNVFLGEQGMKCSEFFVGRDDYTMVLPKFPVQMKVISKNLITNEVTGFWHGGIETIVNTDSHRHYAYLPHDLDGTTIVNESINNNHKVLLIGDSFSYVIAPFISQAVKQISGIIIRDYPQKEFNLRKYIKNEGFDTVIVLYYSCWLPSFENNPDSNAARTYLFR